MGMNAAERINQTARQLAENQGRDFDSLLCSEQGELYMLAADVCISQDEYAMEAAVERVMYQSACEETYQPPIDRKAWARLE